jgi:hypothetical protein
MPKLWLLVPGGTVQAPKQRLLLHNAAVQLRDAFGNAAECSGVQVRFRLQHQHGGGKDGELPQLDESQQRGVQDTDGQGRAFFGNLLLAQGSGVAEALSPPHMDPFDRTA